MTTSADEPVTEDSDTEVVEAEVDEFDETEFAEDRAIDEADIEDAEIETAVEMDAAEGEAGDAEEPGDRGSAEAGERDDSEPARATARVHSPRRAPRPPEPEQDEFAEPATESTEPQALEPESDAAPGRSVPIRRGRGGYDPEADAVARAARYRFRQRTTLGLALSALLFGAAAVAMTPLLWWGCGASVLGLVGYLIYLRRQVRFEEDIRRRRAARLSRGARPAGQTRDSGPSAAPAAEAPPMDRDTARDLRRRAVVLDVDDEDPSFDFLENFDAAAARATRVRAGGNEIRRAAGE